MSYINNEMLSSDSEEEIHPNIDEKSFKAWKRAQKELKMKEKEKALKEIQEIIRKEEKKDKESINNSVLNQLKEEESKLEKDLKPILIEKESATTFFKEEKINKEKTANESENDNVEDNEGTNEEQNYYTEQLIKLLNNSDLCEFIKIIDDNKKLDLKEFEEFVLFNLSENIKDGNDEAGIVLSRISLYIKYAKNYGRKFMINLNENLKDAKKAVSFNTECINHYAEAKKLILSLQYEE